MPAARSFRLVCAPTLFRHVEDLLHAEGFEFESEPFSVFCRKIEREPFPLGASLAAVFGYIYIQDRSSMLPPLALEIEPGSPVLDMAASPGSKTGFLAQLTGPQGFVLANEPSRQRLGTLRANLQRANLLQAATCSYDGARLPLFANSWPYILLDPPCSGWGTAEKHPRALKIWQGEKIERLIAIQRRLLQKAAALLADSGRLLYSTCTTNDAENEAQTAYAVEKLGLEPLRLPEFKGFTYRESPQYGLTIEGQACGSQGFYLSLLTKKGGQRGDGPRYRLQDEIAPESLSSNVFDPAMLPAGKLGLFQRTAHFLPELAFQLPAALSWQGFAIGRKTGAGLKEEPTLRALLPPLEIHAERIIMDEISDLRRLLSGYELPTSSRNGVLGLWWRDLPLGIVRAKNGRILASFRV